MKQVSLRSRYLRPKFEGGAAIKNIDTTSVNRSSADFVKRLKDPNRKFIQDWDSKNIATHKLSVGQDNYGNYYVYSEIQNINGKLVDFTRPPYDSWVGRASAEERGDTVRMNFNDALYFTENYKNYYPSFNKYKNGGRIKAQDGTDIKSFRFTDDEARQNDIKEYYKDPEWYISSRYYNLPFVLNFEEYENNPDESPAEYYDRLIEEYNATVGNDKLKNYFNNQKKTWYNGINVSKKDTFKVKSDHNNVNGLIANKSIADSLLYNAGKYNSNKQDTIPFNVVFGIPFRESTFGNNISGFYDDTGNVNISPVELLSNWNFDNTEFIRAYKEGNIKLAKKASTNIPNPYFSAWNHYKKGRYNPGHAKQFGRKYEDLVEEEGNAIISSDAFKKYMQERGWEQYLKGKNSK